MSLTKTGICDFGWKAKDFRLLGVDGGRACQSDDRNQHSEEASWNQKLCGQVQVLWKNGFPRRQRSSACPQRTSMPSPLQQLPE